MSYDFLDLVLWFFMYSFIGWLYESLLYTINQRRFINRGFLTGPYCPIYGVGAVLFIISTNNIDNIFLRFLAGAIIACTLEYITSYILEKLFHARWWDYTPRKFNIKGRICLAGFVVFGIFAAILPWVHLPIWEFTEALPHIWRNFLLILIVVAFASDIYATTNGLVKFNRVLAEYQKAIEGHYLSALNFIRHSARTFEMRIEGRRKQLKHRVLSYQQRRTLESFPHFVSTQYGEAVERLRKLNADAKKRKK